MGHNAAMKLVFVIPVHNEEHTLAPLAEGILEHAAPQDCEIVFVDDGSTDASYAVMRHLHEKYPQVRVLKFRRNFGKALALAAAFAHSEGDLAITMDGDLQDDPAEIPKLLAKLDEGFDLVCGWKADRQDPWHKTLPSRLYNRGLAWLFNHRLHDINTGFKAMRMDLAKQLPLYGEMHRMMVVNAMALGYRVTEVPVHHRPRQFGRSHYGFGRFFRGMADALTTWFLNRHGHAPNHFFYLVTFVTGGLGKLLLLAGILQLIFHARVAAALGEHAAALLTFGEIVTGGLFILVSLQSLCAGLLAELVVRRMPPVPLAPRIETILDRSRP